MRADVSPRLFARADAVLAGGLHVASGLVRAEGTSDWALTGYGGRITTVNARHDIFLYPDDLEFADAYLATIVLSHDLGRYHGDVQGLEAEGHRHPELTFVRPGARRAGTMRLHHRFGGLGLLANDGGVNALCRGVTRRF